MLKARKIIRIDEEKCNGCGLCADSCAEGAIRIIDGKARLISESFCDGLGACLGKCPQDALSVEERPAPDFDEKAVKQHDAEAEASQPKTTAQFECGCPGSALRMFDREKRTEAPDEFALSDLSHWPVQLKLAPPSAPFLKGADLLICADCVPFAFPDFHARYLRGRAVLVGCPKLDDLDFYRQKLQSIFTEVGPKSILVLRMEVPCCGGLASAVLDARDRATPHLPVEIHTIGIRGKLLRKEISQPPGVAELSQEVEAPRFQ